jgi:L-amino acid N-acyltransferase YncA
MADAERIAAIYNQAVLATTVTFDIEPRGLRSQQQWLAAHGERHPVIVEEEVGLVRGWASLSPWSDRAAYGTTAELSVYVDEAHRGRGIGAALVRELVERARRLGYHTIVSRITAGNPASIRLHERAGFVLIGTMREVGRKFGRWLDVVLMQLIL